jgi:hypothetical protein
MRNPDFAVKMIFNFGAADSNDLRAQSHGDFTVLCGLPPHPGVIAVYASFVDTIPDGGASP